MPGSSPGMTSMHDFAISPHVFARGLLFGPAPSEKGAGNAGRSMRPIAACAMVVVERTRVSQVTPESPGIPRAMVYSLYRALPGARALWPPSSAKLLPPTGHQRRGVRTTRLRRPLSRRSSPALPASTASRPAFRDVAQRPSVGRDGVNIGAILILENRNIFAERTGQP